MVLSSSLPCGWVTALTWIPGGPQLHTPLCGSHCAAQQSPALASCGPGASGHPQRLGEALHTEWPLQLTRAPLWEDEGHLFVTLYKEDPVGFSKAESGRVDGHYVDPTLEGTAGREWEQDCPHLVFAGSSGDSDLQGEFTSSLCWPWGGP